MFVECESRKFVSERFQKCTIILTLSKQNLCSNNRTHGCAAGSTELEEAGSGVGLGALRRRGGEGPDIRPVRWQEETSAVNEPE